MAFAKTPHGKIHYTIKGQGDVVVLIRGLGRWSVHWHGWDHELAKEFKVITFDSKGLGYSTSPMRPWHSIKEIAEDIASILKHERIQAAHVIGTSLGGMTALEFALSYPELTKSITVIAASIGRSGHMRISRAAAKMLILAPRQMKNIYPELARLLTSPASPDHLRLKLASEWAAEDEKYRKPIFPVIGQLIAAFRFRHWERLAQITSPAHIIAGKDDLFVPLGNSLFLHKKMPGSQLTEVDHAGHEPHVDQPTVMTKVVSEFIKKHSPTA